MRFSRSALVVTATAALVSASAIAWASAGDQAADDIIETDLITKELPDSSSPKPLLRVDGIDMKAGEPRLLTGKFSATMSFAKPPNDDDRIDMLMSTWITCAEGEPAHARPYPDRTALSSRNHEGEGRRTVTSVGLYTPKSDGEYTCIQWAVGSYTIGPSRSLKPVAGADHTYLRVDGEVHTGGAEWYQKDDKVVRKDDPKTSTREDKATILRKDWKAGSGKVKVFHGTQATAGVAGIAGMDPLVLRTDLVATQLSKDGTTKCATATGTDKQSIYQGSTHHLKISRWVELTLSKDPKCSTTVRVEVRAQYILTLSGTPNKAGTLHGALSDPLRPYSTALAVNV
ncbi:hypothetical protein [Stackebrandtia nassauensis]|uniref:Secreted protein n=1 Tax=Stackebrandtia nassauensis (strain DSM 44728 / CIP 108903 / NRRL B-16338 / NBRC 102104 / LLR-40K-21) TaxID=446470 RepID=D3Q911_STANL|nr:hypothetical protein [Stackebrandtia nassauensis]ADD40620.1 hypothetical protein Snas_0909 [Stackebrandtia nassauensis DSM 44728]